MTSPFTAGNNSSGARDFFPGMVVLNTYEVRDLLGRGGMGAVYRVYHRYLQKDMAMKTLRAEQVASHSWLRFQAEAKAIAKLEHPNIIQIFDMGVCENGQPFYTMELLNGMGLDDWTKHNPISITQTLFVFRQVACGLAFAHERGIIHRDVKPANIVLTFAAANQSPVVKLVDFGIAKLLTEAQGLTKEGEVFGSPLYISPEQATGLKVDPRSDIYSLGCALYETLTGFPPFRGKTAMDTMMMHLDKPAVPIERARPEVNYPPGLSLVLQKCMAKQPEARYENASQLAQDLQKIEHGKGEEVVARLLLEEDVDVKVTSFFQYPESWGVFVNASGAAWPLREYGEQELESEAEEEGGYEPKSATELRRKSYWVWASLTFISLAVLLWGIESFKRVSPHEKLSSQIDHFQLTAVEFNSLNLKEPYDENFVYYLFPPDGEKLVGKVRFFSTDGSSQPSGYVPAVGRFKVPYRIITLGRKRHHIGLILSAQSAMHPEILNRFNRVEVGSVSFPVSKRKPSDTDIESDLSFSPEKSRNLLAALRRFEHLSSLDTSNAKLDDKWKLFTEF